MNVAGALIRHLRENNREQVSRSSFLNCHVIGLTSIMLLDEPGKRIRLFVAGPGHQLWRNAVDENGRPELPLSLGFHSHHCDMVLVGVRGTFRNVEIKVTTSEAPKAFALTPYVYRSQILTGQGGFEIPEDDGPRFVRGRSRWIGCRNDHSVAMKASAYHTVFVPATEMAAWLVFEGAEDPNYRPITYSNHDLTRADFGRLYLPASESDIDAHCELAVSP